MTDFSLFAESGVDNTPLVCLTALDPFTVPYVLISEHPWVWFCSYLVVVGTTVVVYSAATSEAVGECKHDVRVNSACFSGVSGEGGNGGGVVVATCADDKAIRFFRADGANLLVSKGPWLFGRDLVLLFFS